MASKPDSVGHTEDRRIKIKDEYDQYVKQQSAAEEEQRAKQAEREAESGRAAATELARQAELVSDKNTREQILDQVRRMREEKPPVYKPPPMTEFQKTQLEIEQECGRQRVARAEAEIEMMKEARAKYEIEQKAWLEEKARKEREGKMQTVQHPNPGMDEQYPASKATLGKK